MGIAGVHRSLPERHMLHRLQTISRVVPPERVGAILAALTVGLAGLIHLALIREHFEEQVDYGFMFTSLAVFQLSLAVLLVTRPGPRVYQIGIGGSGVIALVYVATRLVPPPGSSAPEELSVLGTSATALELAAVVLLALALPDRPDARPHVRPLWWGVGGGLLTVPVWLLAAGMLQWTPVDLPAPSFIWYGQRSPITPALAGSPLPHLWLFAPWWTLLGAAVIAALVGLNLWLATRLALAHQVSCRQRRVGLLSLVPAALAGPVCCGAPLVALLGIPALVSLTLAPYVSAPSVALLGAQFLWLWHRHNLALSTPACSSEGLGQEGG